jgi:hypothetical protein
MAGALDIRLNNDQWADWRWRISNLYSIVDDEGHKIPFRPNQEQLRFIEDFWTLNLILKARQLGFCVDPSTRVLTADLRWVKIAELCPGQEIVAVDEQPPGGKGKARRMRTATVLAAKSVHRMAYRIKFDDGREVVCTDMHPWLTRKAGDCAEWRSLSGKGNQVVGRIKVGTSVRWVAKPWSDPTVEDGWFGGMLDGEGSISKINTSAGINVSQRVGPVWDRLVAYCEQRGYNHCVEDDKAERLSKYGKVPVPKIAFGRMDEMFRVIGQTRPTRFIGKHFWEGRELPGKRNGDVGWATVVSIEPLGEQTLVDLQTSTGTYIAEGFVSHNTTLIDIIGLDLAVFNSNQTCGVIAHNLDDARKIFKNKVKFPYENLPDGLRKARTLETDSAQELAFDNGSSMSVSTSMRSGTLQFLHVSEFGKICAKFPDKAKEIVAGSFNTVKAGQFICVESTAEGRYGKFWEYCKEAQDAQKEGKTLTELDFRFHFFAWWEKDDYRLDANVPIPTAMAEYFKSLQDKHGIFLDRKQKAWYVKKASMMVDDMKREFPSVPGEAFEAAIDGAYYAQQMAALREAGRLRKVPHVPTMPVNTFWDLGRNDTTFIWFHQFIAGEHRFFKTHEKSGEDLAYYYGVLQAMPKMIWGYHYLPHDAENQNLERNESRVDRLIELGISADRIRVVDKIDNIADGIEMVRRILPQVYIDEENCDYACLDNYQKEWSDKLVTYLSHPLHNWASNGADAFRQFAQGWTPASKPFKRTGSNSTSHRTA